MKHHILPLVFLMILSVFCHSYVINAQTVVFDEEIYWEWDIPQDYGGYSFYWWHRLDGYSNYDLGDMPSDDWTSPNNFYSGEFRMRFEVISQPSSEPFYIQFGIWQDSDKGSDHPETVCGRQYVSSGSVFQGSLGSPTTWWQKEPDDPVDFSRPEDFYRIGIVLWNDSPLCIPMGTSWNADGCPENAYKYFPMRARVTITAYPGSGGPVIYPPNYAVDYYNERTSKVVSTEDQYSYDNFSGGTVYDGEDSYLTLTPGQDVYFRKKADYTKKQTLDVPSRPSASTFGIDFINERTNDVVSDAFEYSYESDMSDAVTGSGSYLDLTPGDMVYFRKKATSSAFRSNIQTLSVPIRPPLPGFEIDYLNERTKTVIGEEFEYASAQDMSGAISGNNNYLEVFPGQVLYFRMKASPESFTSEVQSLSVPERPAAPGFAVDFDNEETSEEVGSEYIYATDSTMNDAIPGDGSLVQVVPGSRLYIQKIATDSTFQSHVQVIILPDRPETPSVSIDYLSETTGEVINDDLEYSGNITFVPSETGTGQTILVEPGDLLYFRKLATDTSFSSEIFELAAPLRPVILGHGSDTLELDPFLISVVFYQQVEDLDSGDFTLLNAEITDLGLTSLTLDSTVYEALVHPADEGEVQIGLNANAITGGNFQSDLLELYINDTAADQDQIIEDSYAWIYPNPSRGMVKVESYIDSSEQYLTLKVFSLTGNLIHTEEIIQGQEKQLNLEYLDNGIYILKIHSDSACIAQKLIIQK